MRNLLFETDWLASRPVFYNEKTGHASYTINDVIDLSKIEFHPEGFNNYLDFGYSVLEQTPIKHVKFLRHSSKLWKDKGRLEVEYLDDPIDQYLNYKLSENEVIELIRDRVQQWEKSVEGEIILPLSGGYDSRLLAWCIEDKSRIRAYTYGISENQTDSFEVVYASKLSKILGLKWQQIQLGDFHQYFNDWDALFGTSTHAHGMYHIEFYTKILNTVTGNNPFLSGIIGDAWAGSVNIPRPESAEDVRRLGYSHGLQIDSTTSKFNDDGLLLSNYWEKQKNRLADHRIRVIEAMRFKIILLRYLRDVPLQFGFKWWSPFLDIDICMAMLNLPQERKQERLWQKEFFQKVGLDLESMNLNATRRNTLDLQALNRIPVKALDVFLLKDFIKPEFIEEINKSILNKSHSPVASITAKLIDKKFIGSFLKKMGLDDIQNAQLKAYNNYVVLLPIEKLLQRQNKESSLESRNFK